MKNSFLKRLPRFLQKLAITVVEKFNKKFNLYVVANLFGNFFIIYSLYFIKIC